LLYCAGKITITEVNNNPVAGKFLILSNSLVLVNLTKQCMLLQLSLVGWFFIFHFAIKSTGFCLVWLF